MASKNEVATVETTRAVSVVQQLTADDIVKRVELIDEVKRRVMKPEIHYGIIPGTQKPTLLQPGAQILCLTFKLRPEYTIVRQDFPDGHLGYEVVCKMFDANDNPAGEGVGCCSTLESKYRWRKSQAFEVTDDPIPNDYRNRKEYYRSIGYGCRKVNDEFVWVKLLKGQEERVPNPDIADVYNTVLKIAKKRAYVDATIQATAASDQFTQDMEDFRDDQPETRSRGRDVPPTEQPRQTLEDRRQDAQAPNGNGNQNWKRPVAPATGSPAFRKFFDQISDIIDPENYGPQFPKGHSEIWAWLQSSGTAKQAGMGGQSMIAKSDDENGFANMLEMLHIEAQRRVDDPAPVG